MNKNTYPHPPELLSGLKSRRSPKRGILLLLGLVALATPWSASAQQTATAPVGGDLAALQAASRASAATRQAAEKHRIATLAEIQGGDARHVRADLAARRAAWRAPLLKAEAEAGRRRAEIAARSGVSESWTGPDGTQYALVGETEGGMPRVLRSHGSFQLAQAQITELQPGGSYGYSYTGAGYKAAGVWELGLPRVTHLDFADAGTGAPRVSIAPGQTGSVSDHANMVTGILIGGGINIDPSGDDTLGAAYEGAALAYVVSTNEFTEMTALALDQMTAHNHSYGFTIGWDGIQLAGSPGLVKVWWGDLAKSTTESHRFGRYDAFSANVDTLVRVLPYTLPVWSAGNDTGQNTHTSPAYAFVRVIKNGVNQGNTYYFTSYNGAAGFHNGSLFWPATQGSYSGGTYTFTALSTVTPISISGVPAADGGASATDTIPQGYGTAKNTLTVGSLNAANSISIFSARGPVDDGRVKPDVVAPGENVFAAYSLNNTSDVAYASASGTSFSAPAVTGGIQLLAQHQETLLTNLEPLRASSYRALVIHTAQDLGTAGPDYTYGWGAANLAEAGGLLENNAFSGQRTYLKEIVVPNGGVVSFTIKAAGGSAIKATAAWSDPAGAIQADILDPSTAALRNNLDLRLYRLNASGGVVSTHLPWRLNPLVPATAATRAQNDVDNVEQVVTPSNVVAGTLYRVELQQKAGTTLVGDDGVTLAAQPVSLLLSGVVDRDIPFAITSTNYHFGPGTAAVTLTWGSHAGMYYQIEYTNSLVNPII